MEKRIYFDNSATTPTDPRVRDAMLPYLGEVFGNPSSMHEDGRIARAAVDAARAEVAKLFNADPGEVIFTASGTEADNLAILGVAQNYAPGDCHIVTTAFEHPAVIETCRYLEKLGYAVTYLPVSKEGLVSADSLRAALRPETRLVSIMAANNVVGTLQPIAEFAAIARSRGILFHTDAVQAAGKIPIDLKALPVDMLSLSAHKLNGPKGIGALIIRGNVPLKPIVHGGGQERKLRSATENVPGIVGFGTAARIAREEMSVEAAKLVNLRERLVEGISEHIPNAYLIGHRYRRLPGHVSIGISGQEPESIKLMLALDQAGFSVSTGSACSAHNAAEPSYVLQALGFDPIRARGSLRITLGRFNTAEEVEKFLSVLPAAVASMRSISTRKIPTTV